MMRSTSYDKGATQASKGEEGGQQVSADLTYHEWLKRSQRDFRMRLSGRFAANCCAMADYRQTGFPSYNSARFSALTLEQMRELEPLAFKRAGFNTGRARENARVHHVVKFEVDTVEGLDASIAGLYDKTESGKFRLKVEGIEDTTGLETAAR